MFWLQIVLAFLVSCAMSFVAYRRGYGRGMLEAWTQAVEEIERNGIRREMHDAGRTALPREGTRAAVVRRIRIKRK